MFKMKFWPPIVGMKRNQKAGNRGSKTPVTIIALTAHAMKEHTEKSIAAGCDGHLTKPIKKRVLIDTLEQLFTHPPDRK